MLKRIDSKSLGGSSQGWLNSKFHFSFADYYNPKNIRFGQLRVINDDLVEPKSGFERHPHRDMEIISYVVDGELTHADSMGNSSTLSRGQVQYMSAGTGVQHSEHNQGSEMLRLIQIWIYPDQKGLKPNYGEYRFNWEDRKNRWLHMISGAEGNAPIKIHQDSNLYVIELDAGKEIEFPVQEGRQAYLVQLEGTSDINGTEMLERDGMEIVEEKILVKAHTTSHLILIEMKKEG